MIRPTTTRPDIAAPPVPAAAPTAGTGRHDLGAGHGGRNALRCSMGVKPAVVRGTGRGAAASGRYIGRAGPARGPRRRFDV